MIYIDFTRAYVRKYGLRAVLVSTCLMMSFAVSGKVIHKERSLYQTILVSKTGSIVCLQFSVRKDQRNQTCLNTNDPELLVFAYTRMMMGALLLNPNPEKILMIGLGGGVVPTALADLYPNASIDVVEIDPAVVKIAKEYFAFQASPNMTVKVQDARVFTKRALHREVKYDLILLDAFNGDYIPEHLMSQEYLEETKGLLTAKGVVSANTFSISELYHHESATYQKVFGSFLNHKRPETANRIIHASNRPLPKIGVMQERARLLAPKLEKFGVRIEDFVTQFSARPDWNTDARVLTDQYSPANLLQQAR